MMRIWAFGMFAVFAPRLHGDVRDTVSCKFFSRHFLRCLKDPDLWSNIIKRMFANHGVSENNVCGLYEVIQPCVVIIGFRALLNPQLQRRAKQRAYRVAQDRRLRGYPRL